MTTVIRCPWAKTQLDIDYHDREWGVPLHDDRALFSSSFWRGLRLA